MTPEQWMALTDKYKPSIPAHILNEPDTHPTASRHVTMHESKRRHGYIVHQ